MSKASRSVLVAAGLIAVAACGKTRSDENGFSSGTPVSAAAPACLAAFPREPPRSMASRNAALFVPVGEDAATPPPRRGEEPITLSIAAAPRAHAGAALDLRVMWENHTARDASLVHPVHDGSFRRPQAQYALFAKDLATGIVHRFVDDHVTMCGTMNYYAKEDHQPLPAGARFDAAPFTRTGFDLRSAELERPGHYQIWLVYRFCGYADAVTHTFDAVRADVFQGVASSNALDVEVVD